MHPSRDSYDSPCHVSLLPLFRLYHPPPTAIYTLSLHDALPIYLFAVYFRFFIYSHHIWNTKSIYVSIYESNLDRKSTRLNSSHVSISYAVFCLKKKINLKHTLSDCTTLWHLRVHIVHVRAT